MTAEDLKKMSKIGTLLLTPLGRKEKVRLGRVSYYKGNYYVDNILIYLEHKDQMAIIIEE
mgnify:CR=1 FL=1